MVEIERALRPFWMHQVVEYVIGVVLISAAFQSPTPAPASAMGVLIMLNAAIAIGPAGAFRLVPRRIHRWCDVVLMGILVAVAVQPWVDIDGTSRLMIGAIAFVLFFIWFHTDFEDREGRKARRAARAKPSSEQRGRQAGRVLGDSVNAVKRWRDEL
jgi:hypothetical protein